MNIEGMSVPITGAVVLLIIALMKYFVQFLQQVNINL
jgi:hypothetical protein